MSTAEIKEREIEKSLIIRFFSGILILITASIIIFSFQNSIADNKVEQEQRFELKSPIRNFGSSSTQKTIEIVNTIFANY
ncbi:MAG: hypothetical protein WCH34_09860 [Bacteroidota bacterium]